MVKHIYTVNHPFLDFCFLIKGSHSSPSHLFFHAFQKHDTYSFFLKLMASVKFPLLQYLQEYSQLKILDYFLV